MGMGSGCSRYGGLWSVCRWTLSRGGRWALLSTLKLYDRVDICVGAVMRMMGHGGWSGPWRGLAMGKNYTYDKAGGRCGKEYPPLIRLEACLEVKAIVIKDSFVLHKTTTEMPWKWKLLPFMYAGSPDLWQNVHPFFPI